MLNLTKRVDYALIALTHLALRPGQRYSSRGLAETYQLSRPLMANVLKDLAKAEIIRSLRGTKGGYELDRLPAAISVGEVVEVLEGPLQLAECVGSHHNAPLGCEASRVCPVKHSVFKIQLKIRDVLYGESIDDLASGANVPGERLPVAHSASCLPIVSE